MSPSIETCILDTDIGFFSALKFGSSICIQLLLFQNNPNNVYLHSFPVALEFLELSYRNSIKRNQEAHLIFTQKTPTLYQWTTKIPTNDNLERQTVMQNFFPNVHSIFIIP